ncbi:MAG TPA: hypothetical protein VFX59_16795 [Polyangiales bacterium]|nr:hypothetical protein [Polyangiales bacterium]
MAAFGPAAASAQSKPVANDATPEYRALIDEAVREYEARHFEEARSLFARAVALQPSARGYRGLGMSEFELRNYLDSADNLERSLSSQIRPIEGELRAETERLLTRARGFLARYVVVTQPRETQVFVDGNQAKLSPVGELLVPVGDHTLEFRAEGFLTERQNRKVNGGEQEQIVVFLKTVPSPADVAAASMTPAATSTQTPYGTREDHEPARKPLYKNPWLWTAVGVVVVAAAVGTGIALSGGGTKTEAAIASNPSASLVGPK